MNFFDFQIIAETFWERKGAFGIPFGVMLFAFWCIMMMKNSSKEVNQKNIDLLEKQNTELSRIRSAEEQRARKELEQKQVKEDEIKNVKENLLTQEIKQTEIKKLRKKIAEMDAKLQIFSDE
jgi:hypothetical protein